MRSARIPKLGVLKSSAGGGQSSGRGRRSPRVGTDTVCSPPAPRLACQRGRGCALSLGGTSSYIDLSLSLYIYISIAIIYIYIYISLYIYIYIYIYRAGVLPRPDRDAGLDNSRLCALHATLTSIRRPLKLSRCSQCSIVNSHKKTPVNSV